MLRDGATRRPISLPSAQMSFQRASTIRLNSRKTWCGGEGDPIAYAKHPHGHFATSARSTASEEAFQHWVGLKPF
jgi:hypothetical protein